MKRLVWLLALAGCSDRTPGPWLPVARLAGPYRAALDHCKTPSDCRVLRQLERSPAPYRGALLLEERRGDVTLLLPAVATDAGWFVADFGPYSGGPYQRTAEPLGFFVQQGPEPAQVHLHARVRSGQGDDGYAVEVLMACGVGLSGQPSCTRPITAGWKRGQESRIGSRLDERGRLEVWEDAAFLPGAHAGPDLQLPAGTYELAWP